MLITSLIEKNNRIQVHIDDKYSFSCSMDFVLEHRLFKGKEVDKKELDKLSEDSELDILKSKLIDYIYSKPYSKREIFNKLDSYCRKKYKSPLDKSKFEEIFEIVSSKGYYDQDVNISKWVKHYLDKNKGERYIQSKLMAKGYEEKEIRKAIKSTENKEDTSSSIMSLLDKKLDKVKLIDQKLKDKTIRYLLAQGFSYDEVKREYKEYLELKGIKEVRSLEI